MGLGDERTTDAGATAFEVLGVSLVQNDAHRRKNRDMQDSVELCRKFFRLFD